MTTCACSCFWCRQIHCFIYKTVVRLCMCFPLISTKSTQPSSSLDWAACHPAPSFCALTPSSFILFDMVWHVFYPLFVCAVLFHIHFFCNRLSVPGSVRLQGGRSKLDGRVEVYLAGVWGSVCSDEWGDEDAVVVCRQLGKGWDSHTLLSDRLFLSHAYSDTGASTITVCQIRSLCEDAVRGFDRWQECDGNLVGMFENVTTLQTYTCMRSLNSLCTFLAWPLHSNPPPHSPRGI